MECVASKYKGYKNTSWINSLLTYALTYWQINNTLLQEVDYQREAHLHANHHLNIYFEIDTFLSGRTLKRVVALLKNTFPKNLCVMTPRRGGACRRSGSCVRRVKCVWQESKREEGAAAHEWKSAPSRYRHHFSPPRQSPVACGALTAGRRMRWIIRRLSNRAHRVQDAAEWIDPACGELPRLAPRKVSKKENANG